MIGLCSVKNEIVCLRSTNKKLDDKLNHQILTAAIQYNKNAQRLEDKISWILKSNPFHPTTLNVLVYLSS